MDIKAKAKRETKSNSNFEHTILAVSSFLEHEIPE
jgi:hypothetical protein